MTIIEKGRVWLYGGERRRKGERKRAPLLLLLLLLLCGPPAPRPDHAGRLISLTIPRVFFVFLLLL